MSSPAFAGLPVDLRSVTLATWIKTHPTPPIIDHHNWAQNPATSTVPILSSSRLDLFRSRAHARGVGCIILAAGRGTRFTGNDPKVISSCHGKPMGKWVLDAAVELELPVVVVVGYEGRRVSKVLGADLDEKNAVFVLQEEQLGTGHAVGVALGVFGEDWDGDVVVMCGDSPGVDAKLIKTFVNEFGRLRDQIGAMILTGSRRVVGKGTGAYGRIVRAKKESRGPVLDIVEKKQIDRMGREEKKVYKYRGTSLEWSARELDEIDEFNSGIYVAKAQELHRTLMTVVASQTKAGPPPKYEYYATDFVKGMVAKEVPVAGWKLPDENMWKLEGANTVEELRELAARLKVAYGLPDS